MTVKFESATKRKQRHIWNVLKNLELIPKVHVTSEEKDFVIKEIMICHEQQYMPDLHLIWCSSKEHYRVYIHVAYTNHGKENAGYCICVVPTGMAAIAVAALYSTLNRFRANNKESAE